MMLSYSSSIQAMICGVVLTSGAGISLVTPTSWAIARMYPRASRSFSPSESTFGSQITPPFPPPRGISTTAVFHVIQVESARTVSTVSSGCQRTPPFAGPRAVLCWILNPWNILVDPSSIFTGIVTLISCIGHLRSSWVARSSPSCSAATSSCF